MDKQTSFEEALTRLEEIVEMMESGTKPLDESLKLYEEGVKLADFCGKKLSSAENTIKKLNHLSDMG